VRWPVEPVLNLFIHRDGFDVHRVKSVLDKFVVSAAQFPEIGSRVRHADLTAKTALSKASHTQQPCSREPFRRGVRNRI